jgi:hypothetical protein
VAEFIVGAFSFLTPVLLVIALGIFGWLGIKSRNIKSFQFQLSLFIVIWIIGEIVALAGGKGLVPELLTGDLAMGMHILAMAVFSVMLWARFYMSQKRGKKLAESLEWT